MTTTKALNTLRERTNWHVARKVLRANGFPASQGWDNTIKVLIKQNYQENFPNLLKSLKELNLCSEKQLTIYDIGNQVNDLRSKIESLEVKESQLSKAYPYSIPYKDVEDKTSSRFPRLIAIEKLNTGTALVYSSYRVIKERKYIDPSELSGNYDDYSEIYAVKRKHIQAFDVVWIPNAGTHIELRLDTLLTVNVHQLLEAKGALMKMVKNNFDINLINPVNIFSTINNLYLNKAEGTVLELGFDTTTASTKLEKMKKIKGAACLRDEAYHIGGKKSLETDIVPFHILLRWNRRKAQELESLPELTISASSLQMATSAPVANDCLINKCMDLDDFNFIQARLLKK